jgi:hypothetical protein
MRTPLAVKWSGETETPPRIRTAARWVGDHSLGGSVAFVRYEGELYRITVTHAVE